MFPILRVIINILIAVLGEIFLFVMHFIYMFDKVSVYFRTASPRGPAATGGGISRGRLQGGGQAPGQAAGGPCMPGGDMKKQKLAFQREGWYDSQLSASSCSAYVLCLTELQGATVSTTKQLR